MDSAAPTVTAPKISSWKLTAESIRETFFLYPKVLKDIWGWLIFLHLIQLGASQATSYAAEYLRASGREDLVFLASIAASEMIFTLIWSSFWILILSISAAEKLGTDAIAGARRPPRNERLPHTINQMLIEETRVLGSILWRIPLLLVPAGVEYVRLTLVPLIVIFDPSYERGERDALKTSRLLSSGHFWLLNWYLVFAALVPAVVEHLTQGETQWIWENPAGIGFGAVLTLFINIGTGIFLFSLYRRLSMMAPDDVS